MKIKQQFTNFFLNNKANLQSKYTQNHYELKLELYRSIDTFVIPTFTDTVINIHSTIIIWATKMMH